MTLTNRRKSIHSGQVFEISKDFISIRIGYPHLLPKGTILRGIPGSLVKQGSLLATIVYKKSISDDIIQGLPKIERILEARKVEKGSILSPCYGKAYLKGKEIQFFEKSKLIHTLALKSKQSIIFSDGDFLQLAQPITQGPINPHEKLNIMFSYYRKRLPLKEACKISFKKIQLFLVKQVQETYREQGVSISNKHIEIIVKQMTLNVCVQESGFTKLLPGEIVPFQQIGRLTNTMVQNNDNSLSYFPVLFGVSKSSLNSCSFLSAASFQETSRILTNAAIEGKSDWLYGVKESVITGRLIPVGTGFNFYNSINKTLKQKKQNENN
jgi:DNA-directed RNA polymerase subunit beta'